MGADAAPHVNTVLRICSIFVLALLTLPALASERQISGVISVHDGDDLYINETRVRLYGIDAPERGQICRTEHQVPFDCGETAEQTLATRFGGGQATCYLHGKGDYGRWLATCVSGGVTVNAWMVSQGWAMPYHRTPDIYGGEARIAQASDQGLHATAFQAPNVFRARRYRPAAGQRAAPNPRCAIKGNVGRDRIYHVPGSRHYSRTTIRADRGERWFCSTAEAEAAGWRAPLG